jgi:hypothetical protein
MILVLSLSLPSFNRCQVDGTTLDHPPTVIGCYLRLDRALLRPISIASSASAAFRIHSAWAFVLIGLALGVAWIGVEFAFWVWREGGHMRRTHNLLCRTSILYSRSRKGFSAQKLGFVCPTHFSELRIFPHFGRFNKTKKRGTFFASPSREETSRHLIIITKQHHPANTHPQPKVALD